MIDEIVRQNIGLMESDKEGGMRLLFRRESIGGNAGVFEGKSCYCANFYYGAQTGKIRYFGNIQEVPTQIVQNCFLGQFKIAMDTNRILEAARAGNIKELELRHEQIVMLYLYAPRSGTAMDNLLQTAIKYNKILKTKRFPFGH